MNIILETPRLILRRFKKEDFNDLFFYLSDPEVVKYEPYQIMNKEEVRNNLDWRIETNEMIAVELKENHHLIGNIYLGERDFNSLELGYVFNKNYWHQGYAKEAIIPLIKESFKKGIHRIYAECDPMNTNSWRLLEKLGFVKEAHLHENVYFWVDQNNKPLWKDTFIYSLLSDKREN